MVKSLKILNHGVAFVTPEGHAEKIEADNVMIISQYHANDSLMKELTGVVDDIYCVGDAAGNGAPSIQKAILEGAKLATSL